MSISIPNTLREIYYNEGTKHQKNVYQMSDNELQQHLSSYNTMNNTNYTIENVKKDIQYIKQYSGKLYKGEYSREGEYEYLRDFCSVDNSIVFTSDKYKKTEYMGKPNFRLLSYNVHAFINSCKAILYKSSDTSNVMDILDLLRYLQPDIIAFQEYTPVFLDYNELNIMNFVNRYTETIDPRMKDSTIYQGVIKKGKEDIIDIEKSDTFFGNLLMSIFKMEKKFNLSIPSTSKESRPFIGSMVTIDGIDLYIFNIHPEAEYKPIEQNKSVNFKQIKTLVDMITLKYPPSKFNIIILVICINILIKNYLDLFMIFMKKIPRHILDITVHI